jgi:hypothetical protein
MSVKKIEINKARVDLLLALFTNKTFITICLEEAVEPLNKNDESFFNKRP